MREYFFRDDDADRDVPQLRRLLATFGAAAVPLNLAVIPGTLDETGVRLLRAQGAWLELHQHGWQHTNHEATGRKCEFGPSRSREQQRDDIAAGQQRMNALFGAEWASIFTPPWNRCTAETHAVLAELGFAAVSQESGAVRADSPLAQLPVHVDIFTWKAGPQLKALTQVEAELAAAPDMAGILLHHKVMDEAAFRLLEHLLQNVASESVRKMSQLLEVPCRP